MNWVTYGPNTLLFRLAEHVGKEALARQRGIVTDLEIHPPAGLVEFVPAFTTILLEFDPKIIPEPKHAAEELLRRLEAAGRAKLQATTVKEIPVRYDGEDLEAIANGRAMTVEKVCQLHCAPVYKV